MYEVDLFDVSVGTSWFILIGTNWLFLKDFKVVSSTLGKGAWAACEDHSGHRNVYKPLHFAAITVPSVALWDGMSPLPAPTNKLRFLGVPANESWGGWSPAHCLYLHQNSNAKSSHKSCCRQRWVLSQVTNHGGSSEVKQERTGGNTVMRSWKWSYWKCHPRK